jgi:hypothetical protein
MTPTDLGLVFGMLLKHREIHGNPPDRPLRENELDAARILSNCSQGELHDLDEFLSSQGFSLHIRDAFDFGIPPKSGRPNKIYVLSRKRGESLAPYLDKGWFIEQMRDGRRRGAPKAELVVWLARMWLTLQWFFYQKIDRLPSEVSRYRDAVVTERLFIEVLSQGIEKMGNADRPSGVDGVAWEHLWESKKFRDAYAGRFLFVMCEAGMIQEAGTAGEYRQTLVAAVDMAVNAESELAYLMPPDESAISSRTVELITGDAQIETEDADPTEN